MATRKPLVIDGGIRKVMPSGDVVDAASLGTGAPTSDGVLRGDNTWSALFTSSATPPSSPRQGDRWLNTTDGIEYTWYVDQDSAQWVDLGKSATVSVNPTVPTYVSADPPTDAGQYFWIQTGLGKDGEDFSLWINI